MEDYEVCACTKHWLTFQPAAKNAWQIITTTHRGRDPPLTNRFSLCTFRLKVKHWQRSLCSVFSDLNILLEPLFKHFMCKNATDGCSEWEWMQLQEADRKTQAQLWRRGQGSSYRIASLTGTWIRCVGNTAGFLQDSGINFSVQSFRVRRKFSIPRKDMRQSKCHVCSSSVLVALLQRLPLASTCTQSPSALCTMACARFYPRIIKKGNKS